MSNTLHRFGLALQGDASNMVTSNSYVPNLLTSSDQITAMEKGLWKKVSVGIRGQLTKVVPELDRLVKELQDYVTQLKDDQHNDDWYAWDGFGMCAEEFDKAFDKVVSLWTEWEMLIDDLEDDDERPKESKRKEEHGKKLNIGETLKLAQDILKSKTTLQRKLASKRKFEMGSETRSIISNPQSQKSARPSNSGKNIFNLDKTESGSSNSSQITLKPATHVVLENHPKLDLSDQMSGLHIKLPSIKLREFDGKAEEFQSFWEQFKHAVHLKAIPAVDKFSYLTSVLKGRAGKLVQGLPFNQTGYEAAIQTLKQFYGQNDKLAPSLYQKLNDLQNPGSDADKLEEFVIQLINVKQLLNSCGESMNHWLVEKAILEKLPSSIQLKLAERRTVVGSNNWSVEEMIEFLLQHSRTLTYTEQFKPDRQTLQSKSPEFQPRNSGRMTYQSEGWCKLCDKDHKTEDCHVYAGEVDRKRQLTLKNRCCKCLKGGHYSENCRSIISCTKCGQSHHIAVCPGRPDNVKSLATIKNPPWMTGANQTELGKPSRMLFLRKQDTSVRSLSSLVRISFDKCRYDATTLFDTGSERSYLDEEVAKSLGIEAKNRHQIVLQPFGSGRILIDGFKTTINLILEDQSEAEIEVRVIKGLKEMLGKDNTGSWIKMLIGMDFFNLFEFEVTKAKSIDGYCIYKSRIGDISAGQQSSTSEEPVRERRQSEEQKCADTRHVVNSSIGQTIVNTSKIEHNFSPEAPVMKRTLSKIPIQRKVVSTPNKIVQNSVTENQVGSPIVVEKSSEKAVSSKVECKESSVEREVSKSSVEKANQEPSVEKASQEPFEKSSQSLKEGEKRVLSLKRKRPVKSQSKESNINEKSHDSVGQIVIEQSTLDLQKSSSNDELHQNSEVPKTHSWKKGGRSPRRVECLWKWRERNILPNLNSKLSRIWKRRKKMRILQKLFKPQHSENTNEETHQELLIGTNGIFG